MIQPKYSRTFRERGAAHAVLAFVAVFVLIGVLGFVGYNAWQRKVSNAGTATTVGVTYKCPSGYSTTDKPITSSTMCSKQNGYEWVKATKGSAGNWKCPNDTVEVKGTGSSKTCKVPKYEKTRAVEVDVVTVGCDKTYPAGVHCSTDKTKPLLTKPSTMTDAQWTSFNPRYGFSFKDQARIWQLSHGIPDKVVALKNQSGVLCIGSKCFNKTQWKEYQAFLESNPSYKVSGLVKWRDNDPNNNYFMTYNSSKKFLTEARTFVGGVPQLKTGEYDPRKNYNPNYFSSAADMASWFKRNGIASLPADGTGGWCFGTEHGSCQYQVWNNHYFMYSDGVASHTISDNTPGTPATGGEFDYMIKPAGWNPKTGSDPLFGNPTKFLQ